MTEIERADAVVDGLAGELVVERSRGWPFQPVLLTLTHDAVLRVLAALLSRMGEEPRIVGLSTLYCCDRPKVLVETYFIPSGYCRRAATFAVCSECSYTTWVGD